MKYFTGFIFFVFMAMPAMAKTKVSSLHEITVMLVNDFSWVQAQVYKKIKHPNPVPAPSSSIKIISQKEIISAYEAIKQKSLPISKSGKTYEVVVPRFSMISSIVLTYKGKPSKDAPHPLPSWIEKTRLNGYVKSLNLIMD